ncbi:MAG: hypothetical protein M3Q10_03655 [Chloroflexota bacterium]|nr:hypothetical protein [Chloroflexota bacterium]
MVRRGRFPRRVARSLRLYAMAVAVNVGVASAAPTGTDPAGRPAVVRYLDGTPERFDPREMGGPRTVLTVPLGEAVRAPSRTRPSPN